MTDQPMPRPGGEPVTPAEKLWFPHTQDDVRAWQESEARVREERQVEEERQRNYQLPDGSFDWERSNRDLRRAITMMTVCGALSLGLFFVAAVLRLLAAAL